MVIAIGEQRSDQIISLTIKRLTGELPLQECELYLFRTGSSRMFSIEESVMRKNTPLTWYRATPAAQDEMVNMLTLI